MSILHAIFGGDHMRPARLVKRVGNFLLYLTAASTQSKSYLFKVNLKYTTVYSYISSKISFCQQGIISFTQIMPVKPATLSHVNSPLIK